MIAHHKVGEVHHYGKILADAYKYGESGHTVTMYENPDKDGFTIVEWDKSGETPYLLTYATCREDADITYVEMTFGISV